MVLTRGQTRAAEASAAQNASHAPEQEAKRDRSSGKNTERKRHKDGATKGDHALAVAASVDAGGEDPQVQLKKPLKQDDDPNTAPQEHAGRKSGSTNASHKAKRKGHHCSSGTASDSEDGNRADSQQTIGAVHKSVVLDKSDHPVAKKRDGRKNQQVEAAKDATEKLEPRIVKINRAPTLTLWVKVVAEREGFSEDTAATFGRAISGMLAQSRGRSLGMFSEIDKADSSQAKSSEVEKATVFGMTVKVGMSHGTTVAVAADGKSIQPKQALGYLSRSFKEDLGRTQKALETLAAAYSPEDIGKQAYRLYEKFRPDAGWGQKGDLDLNFIEALAKTVDA